MTVVGAVDCGTNSIRLLIEERSAGSRHELVRDLRLTRLGRGVDFAKSLDRNAIDRTLSALRDYAMLLRLHRVERFRVAATSAVRDATNADEFLQSAEAVIGVPVEVLSGEEEGRLTFAGAIAGADAAAVDGARVTVVDVGGGSTELSVGDSAGPNRVRSIDIGCVRLTERFLHSDPYLRSELTAARRDVHSMLRPFVPEFFGANSGPGVGQIVTNSVEGRLSHDADESVVIGVAGTVTTLAAMDLGLDHDEPERIHGHRFTREAVERSVDRLASLTLAERLEDPLVPKGRADVLTAGAIILAAVLEMGDVPECIASETDILEGLAASL